MNADSVLSSSIEVAIGIAGFGGIIAAIRQRDVNAWSARDRITLQALFGVSVVAIVFSMLPGILREASVDISGVRDGAGVIDVIAAVVAARSS